MTLYINTTTKSAAQRDIGPFKLKINFQKTFSLFLSIAVFASIQQQYLVYLCHHIRIISVFFKYQRIAVLSSSPVPPNIHRLISCCCHHISLSVPPYHVITQQANNFKIGYRSPKTISINS